MCIVFQLIEIRLVKIRNKMALACIISFIILPFLVLACSFYPMVQAMPVNGAAAAETSKNSAASAISTGTSTQKTNDYDFSALTQGLFTKR